MYPQRMFRQARWLVLVVTLAALVALSVALSVSGADPPQRPPLPSTKLPSTKIIALTFDDGPDPANTPKILDILQRHNVKATFFVEGQKVNDNPSLIWREYQEGHMVGNHSYTHPRLATLSSAGVKKELRDTNTAITSAGVPRPNLFRPPYGSTDAKVKRMAASLGMTQTLWAKSHRTADWKKPMGPPEELCGGMVREAKPGAILVLHDWTTSGVDALECIITRLKAKGYSFGLIYPSAKYNSLNRSYVKISALPSKAAG